MYKDKSICIVVPAYNESTQVGKVISTMPEFDLSETHFHPPRSRSRLQALESHAQGYASDGDVLPGRAGIGESNHRPHIADIL